MAKEDLLTEKQLPKPYQPKIAKRYARADALSGPMYRFALLLPVLREGHPVFPRECVGQLANLFYAVFRGCTYEPTIHPLKSGFSETVDPASGKRRRVSDDHVGFLIYTPRNDHCLKYFEALEGKLRQYLYDLTGLKEDQILIEVSEVSIIASKSKIRDHADI
jgi:hypothetical protein